MKNICKHLISAVIGGLVGASAMKLFATQPTKPAQPINNSQPPPKQTGQLKSGVSSWGNYPKISAEVHSFETIAELRDLVQQYPSTIARGNGRSYGDSALANQMISCLQYNKFLSFDEEKGLIACQAGVMLSEILEVVVPKGWFFAVTPGTKLITVGGAIASDVHGKSQHKAGNFSDHLAEFDIMLADGSVVTCSPTENSELYWTTCGGMGLTGIILKATIKLIPIETGYIRQESIRASNLTELMDLFEESESWTYSLAWIDCLTRGKNMGRGYLMRGEHATLDDLAGDKRRKHPLQPKQKPKLTIPFSPPNFVLNNYSMKLFNSLLYWKHVKRVIKSVIDYDAFFYPLDMIYQWNLLYGSNGFTQYQFILPKVNSREGMQRILEAITASDTVSFLAVLKLYDKQQNSYLPFGMAGYSLALDFPIRDDLFPLLDELDELVKRYGGRLYLTKDVRMTEAMFKETYPDIETFLEKVQQINTNNKFRSLQSDRVGITT